MYNKWPPASFVTAQSVLEAQSVLSAHLHMCEKNSTSGLPVTALNLGKNTGNFYFHN